MSTFWQSTLSLSEHLVAARSLFRPFGHFFEYGQVKLYRAKELYGYQCDAAVSYTEALI